MRLYLRKCLGQGVPIIAILFKGQGTDEQVGGPGFGNGGFSQ